MTSFLFLNEFQIVPNFFKKTLVYSLFSLKIWLVVQVVPYRPFLIKHNGCRPPNSFDGCGAQDDTPIECTLEKEFIARDPKNPTDGFIYKAWNVFIYFYWPLWPLLLTVLHFQHSSSSSVNTHYLLLRMLYR